MTTKQFNWITLTFVATILLFTSCQKDNLTDNSTDNYEFTEIDLRDSEETNGVRCYDWEYPITLQFGSGDTAVINSKDSLIEFAQNWRTTYPGARKPRVKLPANVVLADGSSVTIERPAQLFKITRDCRIKRRRGHIINYCIDLIYPVRVGFPDGDTVTYDDQESHMAAMKAWRDANPDATDRPRIALPQDVELTDGNIVTVETADQFKELIMQCIADSPFGPCIKLIAPFTVDFPDGTSMVFSDLASFKEAIEAWKESNPSSSDRPEISFPYDVELHDGRIITLENKEQAKMLVAACKIKRHGPNLIDNNCFSLDFPVKFKLADGVIIGVADLDALKSVLQNAPGRKHHKFKNYPRIVVPFNVTLKDSGLSVTVDSFEDLKNLFQECRGG